MCDLSKIVYILRGIPGCGKSTLAKFIFCGIEKGITAAYCSADIFFVQNGEYHFEASKLAAAHEYCRSNFNLAIKNNIDVIIIDNTNTTHKEFKFYKEEGLKAEYQVQVITVGEFSEEAITTYAARNIHNVPIEKLKQMRDRFQL